MCDVRLSAGGRARSAAPGREHQRWFPPQSDPHSPKPFAHRHRPELLAQRGSPRRADRHPPKPAGSCPCPSRRSHPWASPPRRLPARERGRALRGRRLVPRIRAGRLEMPLGSGWVSPRAVGWVVAPRAVGLVVAPRAVGLVVAPRADCSVAPPRAVGWVVSDASMPVRCGRRSAPQAWMPTEACRLAPQPWMPAGARRLASHSWARARRSGCQPRMPRGVCRSARQPPVPSAECRSARRPWAPPAGCRLTRQLWVLPPGAHRSVSQPWMPVRRGRCSAPRAWAGRSASRTRTAVRRPPAVRSWALPGRPCRASPGCLPAACGRAAWRRCRRRSASRPDPRSRARRAPRRASVGARSRTPSPPGGTAARRTPEAAGP
jgi:hypothetical protein